MMKTLILGHGKYYEKNDIRCSPIDVDEWFNDMFDSVDDLEVIEPNILFNLWSRPWKFANDNSYDRIIDCTGGIISHGNYNRQVVDSALHEIKRILRPGGIFYADRQVNHVYHKAVDGNLKKIEKKVTVTINNPEYILLCTRFSERMHHMSNVAEVYRDKIKCLKKLYYKKT